tara:strand:- start:3080 stop:4501 length:1422 start_codon:yes stop_codon:yes gene_type:complete
MAKGGAFGNPLTTGIALNFEVDMTPYRQMMQDNLKFAQTQAAERKKNEKEFQDILKNITLDTSKIHERYKKNAMGEYASTINDAMAMHKAGDISSMYQRMNKYKADMNSYVAATQDFNNYKKSKGDKTFRNEAAIAAMDNVEGVSNEQLMKDYQNDVGYSNGLFNFTVIDRPDVIGYGNKILQGVDKEYVRDDKGEIVATETFGDKGTKLYKTSIKDPENFIKETSAWLLGSAGGGRLLMDKYGLTPDQFDEVDPATGRQKIDLAAEDYITNTFAPKLYGEKEKDPFAAKGGGFSFNVGGGRSEGSVWNNSGGRELKLAGGDALKTTGQYDITFTKGTGRTTLSVPSGSYVLDPTTGEYKETGFTGALEDAIPLYPMVGEDGQEWYAAISKGSVSDVDPNMIMIITNLLSSGDAGDAAEAQKMLDKSKYGQTYLIKGNGSVKNQFWGKVLGQDYTKQRANDAMKKLGAGLPDF